jgi:adenine phosphoribosyltransferase
MSPDTMLAHIRSLVHDVPDFPKPGIIFKDISPVLADPAAFHAAIVRMAEPYVDDGVTVVLGVESRGFMFGAPIALELGAAFVPVRKPGKLPRAVRRAEYALEYGTDTLEIHADALNNASRVLLVDDVLATGGTAAAAVSLAASAGAHIVGASFFIELGFLGGRAKLDGQRIASLLHYG